MSFSVGFYAWSKHAPLPSRPDFICNNNIRISEVFWIPLKTMFFLKGLDHEMNIFFGRPIEINQYFLYMLVWGLYFYVALLKVKNKPENTSCTNSRKISKGPIRISVPPFSSSQLSISKVFCTCHWRLSEQCTESQATFGNNFKN